MRMKPERAATYKALSVKLAENFSTRLKQALKDKNITSRELADMLSITKQSIDKLVYPSKESSSALNLTTIYQMSAVLGVKPEILLPSLDNKEAA